ncbi:SpvB/TcaC N-terminal domain-containing protein [Saccharobesus litoralis]|uniref:SpvB/TcaC N-terminal domain-containing protein n=1 Tax=Saccharobesus litoralis TaxID=2172099 RepID=UPI00131F0FFE|nr:SpvB/TcaC N-terminal domain-containing protein [Saccharobesus litoralis]
MWELTHSPESASDISFTVTNKEQGTYDYRMASLVWATYDFEYGPIETVTSDPSAIQDLPLSNDVPSRFRFPLDSSGSLPNLGEGEFVGTSSGTAAVTQSGAARYSVPIHLPYKKYGINPSLAITYSSRTLNCIAGHGWTLTGLSTITRCDKSFATEKGLAAGSNPRLTAADRLCLDGSKLLLSGAGGAASDAEYWASNATYHIEGDEFTRVVADRYGNYPFIVNRRNGVVERYSGLIQDGASQVYKVWGIDSAYTSAGSGYSVEYLVDNDGSYRPDKINLGVGRIEFDYKNKFSYLNNNQNDGIEVRFENGQRINNESILVGVKTYAASSLAREYQLTHTRSPQTGRYLLESMKECDGTNCTLPLVMEYSNGGSGFVVNEGLNSCLAQMNTPRFNRTEGNLTRHSVDIRQIIDLNQDGYDDLIWTENYEEYWVNELGTPVTRLSGPVTTGYYRNGYWMQYFGTNPGRTKISWTDWHIAWGKSDDSGCGFTFDDDDWALNIPNNWQKSSLPLKRSDFDTSGIFSDGNDRIASLKPFRTENGYALLIQRKKVDTSNYARNRQDDVEIWFPDYQSKLLSDRKVHQTNKKSEAREVPIEYHRGEIHSGHHLIVSDIDKDGLDDFLLQGNNWTLGVDLQHERSDLYGEPLHQGNAFNSPLYSESFLEDINNDGILDVFGLELVRNPEEGPNYNTNIIDYTGHIPSIDGIRLGLISRYTNGSDGIALPRSNARYHMMDLKTPYEIAYDLPSKEPEDKTGFQYYNAYKNLSAGGGLLQTASGLYYVLGDFNGDGLQDYAFHRMPNQNDDVKYFPDNIGSCPIVIIYCKEDEGRWYVKLNNGYGFEDSVDIGITAGHWTNQPAAVFDYNNDGLSDLLYLQDIGLDAGVWRVALAGFIDGKLEFTPTVDLHPNRSSD